MASEHSPVPATVRDVSVMRGRTDPQWMHRHFSVWPAAEVGARERYPLCRAPQ